MAHFDPTAAALPPRDHELNYEESDEEDDYEDRCLGPLAGCGVGTLVIEVLCCCAGWIALVVMIVYGILCVTSEGEGTEDTCGPAAYPNGGIIMLSLGWLPCTCCMLRWCVRRVRRKNRIMPAPNVVKLEVCYASPSNVATTTVGPVKLADMPERLLRGTAKRDMLIWVPGLHSPSQPVAISSCVQSNALTMLQHREWDDHRQIDTAGWGGPRHEILEMLRIGLFPGGPNGVRASVPVGINVYDWSGRKSIVAMNTWACCGCKGGRLMGAFHAGVEIMGREYSFGWNDEGTTGVFWVESRGAETLFGHRFREHIPMGHVLLSYEELEVTIRKLETEWMGFMYDMWHKNCNHFCDSLCRELKLGAIPKWINRLTSTGARFWDKAVFSQRIYDRAILRRKPEGEENGEAAEKDLEKNVARLGPSVPLASGA